MLSDQCALGPNGELLPAEQIVFYHNADSTTPLPPVNSATARPSEPRTKRLVTQAKRLTDANNIAEPEISSHTRSNLERSAADSDLLDVDTTRNTDPDLSMDENAPAATKPSKSKSISCKNKHSKRPGIAACISTKYLLIAHVRS